MAIAPARPNIVQPVVSGGGSFTPPSVVPQVDTVEVVEKVVNPVVDTPTEVKKTEVIDVEPEVPTATGGVGDDEQSSPDPVVEKKTPKKGK